MNLTVRGNRVIVQMADQSYTERDSGVITVEAYAPEVIGEIIAAGDVQDVKVGDVVVFPPSAGQAVEYGDGRYLVLREDELLAVVEAA